MAVEQSRLLGPHRWPREFQQGQPELLLEASVRAPLQGPCSAGKTSNSEITEQVQL